MLKWRFPAVRIMRLWEHQEFLVREFSGASKALVEMVEIRHRIRQEDPAVAALNLTAIGMRRTGLLLIIRS